MVALVRTYERARALPAGVWAAAGDVTKPDSYQAALARCEVVRIAAAAWWGGANARQGAWLQAINVEGARAVLDAAQAAGIQRVVHVSSASVYGHASRPVVEGQGLPEGSLQTEYQRTKRAGHSLALERAAQGARVILAVPGVAFGPGDASLTGNWLSRLRSGRLWWTPGPECLRNWSPVSDVARGLRLALERGQPGAMYHLAGPPLRVRDFLSRAARAFHQRGPRVWVSSVAAQRLAQTFGSRWPAQAERWRPWTGISDQLDTTLTGQALGWASRCARASCQPAWPRPARFEDPGRSRPGG